MTALAAVFVPLLGEVIATLGTDPRLTVIGPADALPKAFVQLTVMLLAPVARLTLLVAPLAEAAPLTVQVVPPGIVAEPLTV